MKIKIFLAVMVATILKTELAMALAVGGSAGVDFPFAHKEAENGFTAEGYYRVDPYELRFHYGATELDTYSVVAAMKHFFSDDVARPYVEAAFGPVVVDTNKKGLAYGVKPEVSAGIDLGINRHLSTGAAFRYFGMAYFGNTSSGAFQANHGFTMVAIMAVWF